MNSTPQHYHTQVPEHYNPSHINPPLHQQISPPSSALTISTTHSPLTQPNSTLSDLNSAPLSDLASYDYSSSHTQQYGNNNRPWALTDFIIAEKIGSGEFSTVFRCQIKNTLLQSSQIQDSNQDQSNCDSCDFIDLTDPTSQLQSFFSTENQNNVHFNIPNNTTTLPNSHLSNTHPNTQHQHTTSPHQSQDDPSNPTPTTSQQHLSNPSQFKPTDYALKVIYRTPRQQYYLHHEIAIHSALQNASQLPHPNIAPLYCYFSDLRRVYMCSEYLSFGTLQDLIHYYYVLRPEQLTYCQSQYIQQEELLSLSPKSQLQLTNHHNPHSISHTTSPTQSPTQSKQRLYNSTQHPNTNQHLSPSPLQSQTTQIHHEQIVYYIVSICCGILYCNALGIVHRDLKPENLLFGPIPNSIPLHPLDLIPNTYLSQYTEQLKLLNNNNEQCGQVTNDINNSIQSTIQPSSQSTIQPSSQSTIQASSQSKLQYLYPLLKIADFGTAAVISQSILSTNNNNNNNQPPQQNQFHNSHQQHRRTSTVGTIDYISPEIIQGKPHGFETDYWSIGCILFQLLCGHPPFLQIPDSIPIAHPISDLISNVGSSSTTITMMTNKMKDDINNNNHNNNNIESSTEHTPPIIPNTPSSLSSHSHHNNNKSQHHTPTHSNSRLVTIHQTPTSSHRTYHRDHGDGIDSHEQPIYQSPQHYYFHHVLKYRSNHQHNQYQSNNNNNNTNTNNNQHHSHQSPLTKISSSNINRSQHNTPSSHHSIPRTNITTNNHKSPFTQHQSIHKLHNSPTQQQHNQQQYNLYQAENNNMNYQMYNNNSHIPSSRAVHRYSLDASSSTTASQQPEDDIQQQKPLQQQHNDQQQQHQQTQKLQSQQVFDSTMFSPIKAAPKINNPFDHDQQQQQQQHEQLDHNQNPTTQIEIGDIDDFRFFEPRPRGRAIAIVGSQVSTSSETNSLIPGVLSNAKNQLQQSAQLKQQNQYQPPLPSSPHHQSHTIVHQQQQQQQHKLTSHDPTQPTSTHITNLPQSPSSHTSNSYTDIQIELNPHLPLNESFHTHNHDANSVLQTYKYISNGVYHIPIDIDPLARDLVAKLLHTDISQRFTPFQTLQHAYIKKYMTKQSMTLIAHTLSNFFPQTQSK